VDLFVERAHSVAPAFSADEAEAVVEICGRLDGIPLAIELAASRMASMTASEVRGRLDHRFELLVGSRRGLERHQTLRHAVAWSYEFLDDAEKALLVLCSVFAGGFDLQSACAVAGFDDTDDYAILDLLDALVRKSLLIADRSSGRTRFSMLETIRQFAEEQLVARGEATAVRAAHARYFAGREPTSWPGGTALDSGRRTTGSPPSWPTCALRFAGPPTTATSTSPRPSRRMRPSSASWLGIYEPIAWAEELIEPARVIDHHRLAFLYVIASLCWMPGRIEEAVRDSDAGQAVLNSGRGEVPFGAEGMLGAVYLTVGQPERYVQVARAQLARGRDTHTVARANHVMALTAVGLQDEAIAAATGLIDAAEAVRNPPALSLALLAYSYAFSEADPVRARDAVRRGLVIAQDNGDRLIETHLALSLCRLEAEHGDRLAALDHCTLAVRNYHDAGNTSQLRIALAVLAGLLDRLGRYQSAAVIAGFAVSAFTTATIAEHGAAIAHLRDVLGEQTYESLARKGESMSTAAMATYAYDQIDQVRAELNAVSN
jgi:tetratricopeptide (TPR) repeat protein